MLVVHVCPLRKVGLRCKEMEYAKGEVVGPLNRRHRRASPLHQRVVLVAFPCDRNR